MNKTKQSQGPLDLGTLQKNAETATRNLKTAASKLAAAERTFNQAEAAHFTAIRQLADGVKAVNAGLKPSV